MILGIDPGNVESAFAVVDPETRFPVHFGKVHNHDLLAVLAEDCAFERAAIEMVASYGMAVGREVFETCVWIGRFQQQITLHAPDLPLDLVYRRDVKLHHCYSAKANDSTITQALIDRFAFGVRNRGKGTKAQPGWFYGFRADVWQAYALAVLVADTVPTPDVPIAPEEAVSTAVDSLSKGVGTHP